MHSHQDRIPPLANVDVFFPSYNDYYSLIFSRSLSTRLVFSFSFSNCGKKIPLDGGDLLWGNINIFKNVGYYINADAEYDNGKVSNIF